MPAVVDQGDALCALVHPSLERVVPKLYGRTGCSVGTLCVNKHLFMERVFVEPCGAVEKVRPVFNGSGKLFRCLRRKLGHDL
ncbi:MAG: hypothetical protein PHT58_01870 [Eubacteriales bacterium]|nr:hypothetical protein [Eubacteriales bacterium]